MPGGILLFQNQYPFALLKGVYGAKKPGRSGSHYDQIIILDQIMIFSGQDLLSFAAFVYTIRLRLDIFMK